MPIIYSKHFYQNLYLMKFDQNFLKNKKRNKISLKEKIDSSGLQSLYSLEAL